MGIKVDVEKALIWDKMVDCMVIKSAVSVSLVGNHGTVYAFEGPIFCSNGQEIFEATQILKNRLIGHIIENHENRII